MKKTIPSKLKAPSVCSVKGKNVKYQDCVLEMDHILLGALSFTNVMNDFAELT